MVEVHDVMGLRDAQVMYAEANVDQIYTDLAQGILDHYRRSSLVQEWTQLDAADDERKTTLIGDTNLAAANVLARLQNHLAYENPLRPEEERLRIFDSQEHYERVYTEGLRALSPDQARAALTMLNREIEATSRFNELVQLSNTETQRAQESGDLAKYLLWWHVRDALSVDGVITSAIYGHGSFDKIPPSQVFVNGYMEKLPRWEGEAKAVRGMYDQIRSIPDDPLRPKAALKRMNRKYNPEGDAHILIEYPEGTFKMGGFSNSNPNKERRVVYTGPDLTRCIVHSYNELYTITKKEGAKGEGIPRPFYFTAYEAQGVEGIPDFPEEAKRFVEIYIPDGDVHLPPTRQLMIDRYPGLIYAQKPTVERTDLDRVIISDDNLAHFVLGEGENGNKITQDTVHYAVSAMISGFGNAPLVDVTTFFPLE